MNEMPKMFDKIAKAGNKNVYVKKSALSGASFKEHVQRKDLFPDINSEKWDYVILQGYSREFTFDKEHIEKETIPYLQMIMDSIYTNNPFTNIMFYHTWGYENGYSEREETNTYNKMTDRIQSGYLYVGEKYNLPVVPVGQVWRKVREKSSIDLYADDRAHPSKTGSYLIATTFYNAIFNESTAKLNLSIVDTAAQEVINKIAFNFVKTSQKEYRLKSRRLSIVELSDRKYKFSSYFPNATSIEWFVDGELVNNKNGGKLRMKTDAEHTIELKITNESGEQYSISKVLQRKEKKPRKPKKA